MKWLSVKKHKPQNENLVFIRMEDESKNEIIEKGVWSELKQRWCYIDWNSEPGMYKLKVTHFCIPDPIEIEDDEELDIEHEQMIESAKHALKLMEERREKEKIKRT